jgi:hypothetical protein
MNQTTIVVIVCLLLGIGGTTAYFTLVAPGGSQPTEQPAAQAEADAYCKEHKIAEAACPFCSPDLIAKMGECKSHGFPEALCYQCNPKLMAGFKAEGDWCAGHNVPESQCELCDYGAVHQGPDAKPKE